MRGGSAGGPPGCVLVSGPDLPSVRNARLLTHWPQGARGWDIPSLSRPDANSERPRAGKAGRADAVAHLRTSNRVGNIKKEILTQKAFCTTVRGTEKAVDFRTKWLGTYSGSRCADRV